MNASLLFMGPIRSQVAPRSAERSRWTRQPSCSLLEGLSQEPSASSIGLFLIGPRMPSGRRRGSDQVVPPSSEAMTSPHQRLGLRPTLKNSSSGPCAGWNSTGFQQG